jgi:transglutaminase-like putative cysteine protease
MNLARRELLQAGTASALAAILPGQAWSQSSFSPRPGAWRRFEIVTRVELRQSALAAQAWIPLPSFEAPDWFRAESSTWTTNALTTERVRDPKYGAEMLHVVWRKGEMAPHVEVVSNVATRDRATEFGAPASSVNLSAAERQLYTQGTTLIPVDGLVRETADFIVAGLETDLDKARAIYEWVVENTFRDPEVRGCGVGDIASMLALKDLSGKCADLNALYVGLARAAGIPARDVYGLRVAPSRFGYKSLGTKSEVVTKAQHCRAEIHLDGYGWVAADPADVRKVALEEPPGNLSLDDPKVAAARRTLFGAWEGNWLAYNVAHDIALPGASGPELGFLMYPQAELGPDRLDPLDPDAFEYRITARESTA